MARSLDIDWSTPDGHPAEDDLLFYVDGELAAKDAGNMRAHLEACWSCRVRMEKIQEAISSFIDYRNNVLKPLIDQPPQGWRSFGGKLSRMVAENGRRSLFSQLLGSLEKYFNPLRLSVNRGLMFRVAAGLLAVVTLAAIIINSNKVTTVSADALLQNAVDAQVKQLRANPQPVIHQKLQVKRRRTGASSPDVVNLEIWNDATNSRTRRAIDEGQGQRFLSSEHDPASADSKYANPPSALEDLQKVLLANHMDPQRPLSPSSYQAWRNAVQSKKEEVTRSTRTDGLEVLTLKTVPMSSVGVGSISEASLIVRAYDWHPEQLRLRVRGEKEDQEYELTETVFNVVSLTALNLEIFSEPQQDGIVTVVPKTKPEPAIKASRDPLQPSGLIPAPLAAATAELEVEVLRLLNQAGADLGEQVSVTRTDKGLLHVTGIVETEQRKVDILRALEPVMNNPAVRIEISTVTEALAQQKSPQTGPSPPSTTQRVEIASDAVAVEVELRSYFAREGDRADEAARQFAARTMSRARRAMSYAYALKRLIRQLSADELRGLSPEARNKWLGLIRSHARAYSVEVRGLRSELQPIFSPNAPVGPDEAGEGAINTTDDAQVLRVVERLIELASANDRVIRSAFAVSNETATITAIRSPQFWQSLRSAEHLAEKIARSQ